MLRTCYWDAERNGLAWSDTHELVILPVKPEDEDLYPKAIDTEHEEYRIDQSVIRAIEDDEEARLITREDKKEAYSKPDLYFKNAGSENFSDFMMIVEAASFLGVTPNTLKNWERRGVFKTYRHPINRYRLYKKADLEALLASIKQD